MRLSVLRLLSIIFSVSAFSTACSMLEMSPDHELGSRWDAIDGEPPLSRSRSAPTVDRTQLETRSDLRDLEENIKPGTETRQYEAAKPYLNSAQDRIEFLRLPSYEARERYLQSRLAMSSGVRSNQTNASLRLGMSRQSVESLMGQPDQVEHAGNPVYGNERWQYSVETTSERGFSRRKRVIYFENGRVVGWQTN